MSSERIQSLIHKLESGAGVRVIWTLATLALIAAVGVLYDLRDYRGFSNPEAMDAAQVARNLSEGRGFTTQFVRPFSLYLVQKHNQGAGQSVTNDPARLNGFHPDLANAPVYPTVLAGLMKTWAPKWQEIDTVKPFWSEGGQYQRYKPEFLIAVFNQVLLCAVAVLGYFIARKLFDVQAARLSAVITLFSGLLWKFSVSGLPTMLLLVIFLGLVWCLISAEELGRVEPAKLAKPLDSARPFIMAAAVGLLTGLGMLTTYSFGWLILPVALFLAWYGGAHRQKLMVTAVLTFIVVVSPWIVRNYSVSGAFFGTAGYSIYAGIGPFAGDQLMQSVNPDFSSVRALSIGHKLLVNVGPLLQGDLLLAGGWAGVLFFAGLLLAWRSLAATRLRYFALMSLGVFILVQALGRTDLSDVTPEINSENLLVLMVPLINIFGVVFLLTLVDQMKTSPAVQYAVITLALFMICRPLLWTECSKISTLAYPPYYPPEIQKISGLVKPDELMMSDVPWAVAWYGDRQCAELTRNCSSEFFALNDYLKPVHGVYLTSLTLDSKLMTEAVRGGDNSWANFAFKLVSPELGADERFPASFPLRYIAPAGYGFGAGVFVTDRPRWIHN